MVEIFNLQEYVLLDMCQEKSEITGRVGNVIGFFRVDNSVTRWEIRASTSDHSLIIYIATIDILSINTQLNVSV